MTSSGVAEDTLDPQRCNAVLLIINGHQEIHKEHHSNGIVLIILVSKKLLEINLGFKYILIIKAAQKSFYKFYKQLSKLRKNTVLMSGDLWQSMVLNKDAYAYTRSFL